MNDQNKLTKDEMLTDDRIGLVHFIDMDKIHDTLSNLHALHNFCAKHNYGYGLFKDGSVYISEEARPDNPSDVWWGRLFETGTVETYFHMDKNRHLRPELDSILNKLKENNKSYFSS